MVIMKKIALISSFVLMLAGCASQQPVSELLDDATNAINGAGNAQECAAETYK